VGYERCQQPGGVPRGARYPRAGVRAPPGAAAALSRRAPGGRAREPRDRGRGYLCRRPAHGFRAAVHGHSDDSGDAAVHAVHRLAHHARGRGADAAVALYGAVYRTPDVSSVSGAVRDARGTDGACK